MCHFKSQKTKKLKDLTAKRKILKKMMIPSQKEPLANRTTKIQPCPYMLIKNLCNWIRLKSHLRSTSHAVSPTIQPRQTSLSTNTNGELSVASETIWSSSLIMSTVVSFTTGSHLPLGRRPVTSSWSGTMCQIKFMQSTRPYFLSWFTNQRRI